MHDATKVLLGTTQSSFKTVDNYPGTIAAGKFVVLHASDVINTTLASGSLIGISLGKSLSDISRFACCRKGARVPVLLGSGFTPDIGAQVQAHATDGTAVASGTPVNAYFATSTLTGYLEDGTTANVALIDFPGGL
jgi:hypothetical protein